MKSAICFSDSVGKIIEKVKSIYSGKIIILFTDGTFSLVELNAYKRYCYCPEAKDIEKWALNDSYAIDLGICTKEEQKSRWQAEKARLDKIREEQERKDYERLKAKFKE